jgi:hypothetical protein
MYVIFSSLQIVCRLLTESDVCYTPASFAAADDLANKAKLFEQRKGTVRV